MSEITKPENRRHKTADKIVRTTFAVLVVFVYLFALGSIPLLGPDEPRYAQVAREMFERGDWTTPTLGGFNWFEKPALLYWLQIASYKIFGVSEFAARLGSALCGLGTILSLWILGKSVQGSKLEVQSQANENQSTVHDLPFITDDFANWLFLVAASSIGILAFARGASFDIILTFPITASLVSFFIFDQSNKKTFTACRLPLAAFYFFIGVALLAKGLVGIVFPPAIVAFYFVLRRKLPDKTFLFSILWGTILSFAVASVWYVPMYLANGWTFIEQFFIQHQFQRYTSNKFQHPQPFWFFLLVLPLMTLPWLPFFLAAVYKAFGNLRLSIKNEKPGARRSALGAFAIAWLLVPLVFFSFSGSKLPGYILPALPAAIILTANAARRFAGNNRRRERALQMLALVTLACAIVALQFIVKDFARGDTVKELIKTADARGFASAPILNFNTLSYNAEFYGAGRLIRIADGTQKRFTSAPEISEQLTSENLPVALVLTPLEFLNQLTSDPALGARVLDDNGKLAIVSVEKK